MKVFSRLLLIQCYVEMYQRGTATIKEIDEVCHREWATICDGLNKEEISNKGYLISPRWVVEKE